MSSITTQPTLYFGYGSNLWQHQMQMRCPTSEYIGIARLDNYRWMINDRGYANVVQVDSSTSVTNYSTVVYGLVYSLQPNDEANLDANEGVPIAYTKEDLKVSFWPKQNKGQAINVEEKPEELPMLVYINHALKEGIPEGYVEEVMRKFIPAKHDAEVHQQAMQQALVFEEEK